MVKQVIDIEELLRWTYQDQQTDEVLNKSTDSFHAPMLSMTSIVEQRLIMGTSIDCSRTTTAVLHPDAETTHEAVCKLSPLEIGLIITHAKTDTTPDLLSTDETLSLIEEDPHGATELINFERETYKTWWDALEKLSNLINNLDDYHVTSPKRSRTPWEKAIDRKN